MAGPHYVTKRLLKEFRGDDKGLCELVKATGEVKLRVSLNNAGSEVGIWPEEIERGPLQQWDNRANKILGQKVYRQRNISLSAEERSIVQEWVVAFMIRSPAHRHMCQLAHSNHTLSVAALDGVVSKYYSNPWLATRRYAISNPNTWINFVKLIGIFNAELAFLRQARLRVWDGELAKMSSRNDIFYAMLRSGVSSFIKSLSSRRWTWLHTVSDFVIGDNPFCRTNASEKYVDYPLEYNYSVVFFPFGRHLCLMIHNRPLVPEHMDIMYDSVRNINRLQIASAQAKIWGPKKSLFELDATEIQRHPLKFFYEPRSGEVIFDQLFNNNG